MDSLLPVEFKKPYQNRMMQAGYVVLLMLLVAYIEC